MASPSPSNPPIFPGRLAVLQRVLPAYRVPFFDTLAAACPEGLSLAAGQPRPDESIATATGLAVARFYPVRNLHLGSPGSPTYACWQRGLLPWMEAWRPDALVVEANPRYLSTPRLVSWMHARRKPVLGWGLGVGSGEAGGWRSQRRRGFLHRFEGMLAYSQRGADQYIAQGIPAARVFVALNAVAHRPSSPPPLRPPAFDGRPTLLFVGRLQARKRIDVLLHACAALPQALQPRLWIVGDGPARLELQALAGDTYPPAEFPGDKRGSDLQPYFAAADLFVLPGTGGLAVQEAMASALPVVVAEGDGTQDDLVTPKNGWQVPPGDVQALAAVLQQAFSDPARLRSMGAESYRLAVEEVNIEAMVSVFVRALNRVTAGALPAA
jgi:glycosyltransferase involved in cell wall biosynthesis